MKNTNVLIKEIKLLVYNVNPYVKLLDNAARTVNEFYSPLYEYKVNERIFPESDILKKMIVDDVYKFYGKSKADLIKSRLDNHFMAETATHYSFPKSFDNFYGIDFDSNLTWNAYIISVAMAKKYRQSVHFGIYVTDIPFSSVNSPSVIEITPEISTRIHLSGDISRCVEWYNLENDKIDLCIKKLKELTKASLLSDLEKVLYDKKNEISARTINRLKSDNVSLETTLEVLKEANASRDVMKKFTKILMEINSISDSFNLDVSDFFSQTIDVHKKLFDNLINSDRLGVEQITLSNQTIIKFFIAQLRDKESWWFRVFNNPSILTKFVEELADVRSGWSKIKTDDSYYMTSPFHRIIHNTKKTLVTTPNFDLMEHKPEVLAWELENRELTPTCAMLIVIYLSVGFLPVGGPLQSMYAKEIQKKFCTFLNGINEVEKADEVKRIPVEISLHTAAFDCKDNMGLYNYNDLKEMHDFIPDIVDKIPEMNLKHAHMNALPTLYNFYSHYVVGRNHPDFRRSIINQSKEEFLEDIL